MLRKIFALLMNRKWRKPVMLKGNPLGRSRPRNRPKAGLRLG
jgi:hypothetical protein